MKALMFGWEFPPHILGGLGTASYGLTRGMAQQEDMEITFVIPKPWGDEDQSFLKIIGANSVPVVWKENHYDYVRQRMEGKMSPEEYYHLRNNIHYDYSRIGTDVLGCVGFTTSSTLSITSSSNTLSNTISPFFRDKSESLSIISFAFMDAL